MIFELRLLRLLEH